MAQQVFPQWSPVVRALDENNNEVLLPFAGIHAQTRDGKDEIIVGAGNMVWTGSMWVPVSTQNRLPVDAAVSGTVDVSDRADRQLGKVALTGSLGKSNFYVDRGENLVVPPGSIRVTVFEHVGPLVLDYLEFSTNAYDRIILHIHIRIGGNWVPWRFGSTDASSVDSWIRGVEILDYADGRWEVLHADVGAKTFKARFRETPVSFCEGLRVQLHNNASSTEYNGNVVMFGRLF